MNEILAVLVTIGTVMLIRSRSKKKKKHLQELNALLLKQAEELERVQLARQKEQVDAATKVALSSSFTISSYSFVHEEALTSSETRLDSQACWLPAGAPVEIAGYKLSGGMIYVGEKLRAVTGSGADAALIDPTKPIAFDRPDREGSSMGYWPSYSTISPENRAAYLEWLASGRRNPDAYIGYVFLFLYGLERRLLHDINLIDEVKSEIPALLNEVGSLLEVYGNKSGSFGNYARGLIDAVKLSTSVYDFANAIPPTTRAGWDYPRDLKLALGFFAREDKPVPVDWALSWVRCNPEAQFRTPATRCAEEFDALFKVRYTALFSDGLRINSDKTRMKETHRPASPSLPTIALKLPDVPDVSKQELPLQQLIDLVDQVQMELEQYSRLVGQGKERQSAPTLAVLPSEIQPHELSGGAKTIIDVIEKGIIQADEAVVKTCALTEHYPAKSANKLTKQESTLLAEFLSKRGYGIEPDIRYGGVNISSTTHCAIYRMKEPDIEPGEAFRAATVLLHLGVAMVKADGDVTIEEQKQLETHLEHALELNASERQRLSAHLQWLLVDPPTITAAKSRIIELDESQRRSLGKFLIAIAGADGHISPSEIKILSKIYPLLGLDPDSVYRDVHSLSVSDTGPVTISQSEVIEKGFAIPQQPQTAVKVIGSISLDAERIAQIREKSLEASDLLTSVFAENQSDDVDETIDDKGTDGILDTSGPVAGLDAKHWSFIRILTERDIWSRADLERLAQRHDLLSAGAIEAINEISFDVCGEALIEGDDPIEVNQFAKMEILK